LLERVYRANRIPVRYIDRIKDVTLFCCGYESRNDPIGVDNELRKKLIDRASSERPILEFEGDIVYSSFLDEAGRCVVLGPICQNEADKDLTNAYAEAHNLDGNTFAFINMGLSVFGAVLTLLFYSFTGKMITESDISLFSAEESEVDYAKGDATVQIYQLDFSDKYKERFAHSFEQQTFKHIRDGNVEEVRKMISQSGMELSGSRIGILASNPHKHYEYMICTAIALACRSAMYGGLDAALAYSMSDVFLQRLEKCASIKEMVKLDEEVMIAYSTRVRDLKKGVAHSYIEKCKSFIRAYLNKAFTLDELAEKVGINKSYLSHKFTVSEGMSIMKYTQTQRIEAAKNSLKYSDESLATIATYFCFHSQSHFGAAFKQHVGITPQKYRDKERLADYHY
jgi:AraC-like DNA-binding protein